MRSIYLLLLCPFLLVSSGSYAVEPVTKQYKGYEELQTAVLNKISAARKHVFVAGRKFQDSAIASALFLANYRNVEVGVYLDPGDVELFEKTTKFLKGHSLPVYQLKSDILAERLSLLLVDNELIRVPGYLSDLGSSKTYLVSYILKPSDHPREIFLGILGAETGGPDRVLADKPDQPQTAPVSKGAKGTSSPPQRRPKSAYNYDFTRRQERPDNVERGLPSKPIWVIKKQEEQQPPQKQQKISSDKLPDESP